MPKYYYHCPINYDLETLPPDFGKPVLIDGVEIPLPPPKFRPGYSPDDDDRYLIWGKSDHDLICKIIDSYYVQKNNLTILDFGCSSGRVLRHFLNEQKERSWNLMGIDVQAVLIEWMRRFFPKSFMVLTGSTAPHLPFMDASIDVIYGISVFTHTRYLWDTWLMEFNRVLKPGGICMQSVQCEYAWKFYHEHKNEEWVANAHPATMLEKPDMDTDYLFYGDVSNSQTFYKKETIIEFWGRYMEVVDFLDPPAFSYQNWIVLRKRGL
jgi:SAM-dependent methyltransferase